LIVGIGNILLRDEGLGVRVIEAMHGIELPEDTEIIDGGTSGADLIEVIANRAKLIVIDALDAGQKPGTVFQLTMPELMAQESVSISVHELGLIGSVQMAQQLGLAPREIIVYGVQPKDISPGLEMTPEVTEKIPRIIELLLEEARQPLR
jgi:hydrogenase maturation protease